MGSPAGASAATTGARERILETVYRLFARRGIRAVGIDEVVSTADVAKATLYRHFPSKDDLALAFLERRAELWTRGWVEAECNRRGSTPEERLLAVFDIFDEWFRQRRLRGLLVHQRPAGDERPASIRWRGHRPCTSRTSARCSPDSRPRRASHDVDGFVRAWHILMKGSIVAAGEGDVDAARRAKAVARLVFDQHLGGQRPLSTRAQRPRTRCRTRD